MCKSARKIEEVNQTIYAEIVVPICDDIQANGLFMDSRVMKFLSSGKITCRKAILLAAIIQMIKHNRGMKLTVTDTNMKYLSQITGIPHKRIPHMMMQMDEIGAVKYIY